ncbi:hypothetical protein BN946_scf185042.g122 [Trametes cinnabarina]|uniref:Uncharacterized protein n=1 Tax=Pycnoporus cinnabarinus TaxID=5643 RepID=A0A060S4F5_PYCCI|nr:hypothetical protein BN946_scf185042.g122 [Trametes cinnabarina]
MPPSSLPTVPYASSSPRHSSPTARDPSIMRLHNGESLPPSSLPVPTYQPPSPTSSPRRVPAMPAYPVPVTRRVPLPRCHALRRDPDASGEGRVLVENSDTASPGSHRFSQSRSQSQSQSQSQGQGEDQSQSGSHSTSRSDGEVSLSQALPPSQPISQPYSQPQRPSQLRAELEPALVSDWQPMDEAVPNEAVERVGEAAELSRRGIEEDAQGKSQQSLSYKGDSQNQDDLPPAVNADQQPAPPHTECDVDEDVVAAASGATHDMSPGDHLSAVAPHEAAHTESSPMAVDTPEDLDAAAGSVDGAAPARATIGNVEDSDDSPAELDEPISEPSRGTHGKGLKKPEMRGEAPPSDFGRSRDGAEPSAPGGEEHGESGSRAALDSDDERTAEMVNQYHAKVSKIISARRRSMASKRSSTAVKEASAVEDLKSRTGERRSGSEPSNAQGQVSSHDPSIWIAPTFMQKPQLSVAAASSDIFREGGSRQFDEHKLAPPAGKRKADASPDTPPLKKRRKAAQPISTNLMAAPIEKQPLASGQMGSSEHQSIVPRRIHPPHSGRSSTNSDRASSSASGSSATRAPTRKASKTESQAPRFFADPAQEVKFVDLRSASRPPSRGSSRASGKFDMRGMRAARDSSTASIAEPGRAPRAEADTLRATSFSRSRESINSGPEPPISRTTSLIVAESSDTRPQTRTPTASLPGFVSGEPSNASASRSAGSSISLELMRTPEGPPLLGWDELLDILLMTGRARDKKQKRRK